MKRPSPPSILTVAVITTVTIIFWIFFSVYQILTSKPDVDIPAQLLKPINPTLNQEILSNLNEGLDFQKDAVTHFSVGEEFGGNQNPEETTDEESATETPPVTPTTTENTLPVGFGEESFVASPSSNFTQ